MSSIKMNLQSRSGVGSNHVDKLRDAKIIPGVIYKRGEETLNVQVDAAEFERVYRQAGTTSIIDLDLGGEIHKAIIKDLQKHPVKDQYLHIDFQGLSMNETIKMHIPINLINRDSISLQPSVLAQAIDEVEIECLPMDIPNSAEYDVKDLDFTTPVYVKDLDIAKDGKVTILTDLDEVVCTLNEPTYDEELEDELAGTEEEVDVDVPLVSEEDEEESEE